MPKNRNKLTFKEWHATNPLRAWRLTNGVTQGTVALTLGVSQTSVRLWEFGQMRPTKDHVAGIGKVIGNDDIAADWNKWYGQRPVL